MRAFRRVARLVVFGTSVIACGGAPAKSVTLGRLEAMRSAPAIEDARRDAPQMVAQAESLRARAAKAEESGDVVAADLLAEEAEASYQRAVFLARSARATRGVAELESRFEKENSQANRHHTSRMQIQRETDELEREWIVARELSTSISVGPADPVRERARLTAARTLVAQARLLCSAANLVAKDLKGAREAGSSAQDLAKHLESAKGIKAAKLLTDATASRQRCLSLLTEARAQNAKAPAADVVLESLSAAGGWDPVRDERGIVVALRDGFEGQGVSAALEARLRELGKVAENHATPVQIVVHDAAPANGDDQAKSRARAQAVAKALNVASLTTEIAGTHLPVVSNQDPSARARNARVEVVLVTSN